MSVKPENMIFRFLDTNGNGTGTKNAIGDYSTPTDFYIAAGASENLEIERMIVHIRDAAPLSAEKYGGLAELTNGIEVKVKESDDTVLLDMTDNTPIKSNAAWGRLCYDEDDSGYGSGDDFIKVRWTFAKSGSPVYLKYTDKLVVTISDDLTGLVAHTFMVQGKRRQ